MYIDPVYNASVLAPECHLKKAGLLTIYVGFSLKKKGAERCAGCRTYL